MGRVSVFSLLGLALCALAAVVASSAARAHDARPLSIGLVEQAPEVYRAVVRAPPTVEAANAPRIVWPETCEVRQSAPLAFDVGETTLLACPGGLARQADTISYPVYNPSITTLVRLEAADGASQTAVLPPDQLTWVVPEDPTWLTVARDYIVLGFRHIWEGPDHLLFVAGLMLLARRPRRILLAVTGFTAAHSITLSLATLGIVRVPIAPVEAMIALSIVFLAGELARPASDSFSRRFPAALSFVFGLLHGFGFASALGEIGLPAGELAVGLVFFNLGVEAGQLAFIIAAGALVIVWRRLGPAVAGARWKSRIAARAAPLAAYALGVPAALWFFQRAGQSLSG